MRSEPLCGDGDYASPAVAERIVAELKALGVDVHAFLVDLADTAAVPQLADAGAGPGRPVVGGSGQQRLGLPAHHAGEISAETWDAIFAANLRVPFLLSQRLGLAMKAGGGGHIMNLDDWANEG
jgi:NAD(P)-dependent dehydrogenase (short-subunit alcohol dehydrogenase family)